MPPRIRLQPRVLWLRPSHSPPASLRCRYATATTPAPSIDAIDAAVPVYRFPPTQPPSHKPASFRKSQLHRQYASLLRSSPLMLIFQHNSLVATEWAAVRRELAKALRKVDQDLGESSSHPPMADSIKLQVIQTSIFAAALRVVEFYNPDAQPKGTDHPAHDPAVASSQPISGEVFHHGLSEDVWVAIKKNARGQTHGLEPLLAGPIAILSFPDVTPAHLKAALTTLVPGPDFPAPKRKADPEYHEPAVQLGLQKLMLLGARVEGKVFDAPEVRGVGKIEGGLDGLRAQLVAALQSVGGSLTTTLEGAGKSLYFAVEGRRMDMEEKEKPAESAEKPAETAEKPAE